MNNPFEKIKKEDLQNMGSGPRAMEANKRALASLEEEMEDLQKRADRGEIVDRKVRLLVERRERLIEDQGMIGM